MKTLEPLLRSFALGQCADGHREALSDLLAAPGLARLWHARSRIVGKENKGGSEIVRRKSLAIYVRFSTDEIERFVARRRKRGA